MSPRLTISNLVLKRLENLDQGTTGRLYGVCDDKSILVLGLSLSAVENSGVEELQAFNHDATLHLPGGIVHCGLFMISDENDSHISNDKLLGDSEYPLMISLDAKSKKLSAALLKKGTFEKHDITPISQKEILKELTNLRLTATIPLRCDLEITQVESVLDEFEKKILSGNVAFQFEDKEIFIFGDKPENISGIGSKCSISDLLKALNENNQKNSGEDNNFIRVQMFMDQTNHDKTPQTAPYIKYIKKEFKHAEIQFSLDALLTVPKSLPIIKLYCFLIDGTHRNFTLNRNNLLSQLKKGKIYDVCSPETYHFLPSDLAHFFSIVYSPKESVDDLKATRESFHKMLSLAMDRPLFRQANAYEFCITNKSASNLLLNPHEKLGKSGVSDGEPYLVQGTYAYHHYMQDGFDDNGWGCAYRSLQTIFSWFRFQGYTNKAVPTHKEIQQCLVNIKDKPGSFIGSKQWIGSTEVSFVLDTLLGVTSRIVNVSSGEEMSMKGGELSHHFRTQGTPIMIGGGVLAHTILGVDYNKNTGDIKFLILDPHYTGEEDLGIVLKKGWCGWKGPEFWKKDAFYNMCLPLKPKCV